MDEQDHLEGAQPLSQDREQEPQGLVPPYEGRQTQAKEGLDEHMDKVFDRVDEVPPAPAERSPMRSGRGSRPPTPKPPHR